MKCNICGAEYNCGEQICKYCGNELISQDLTEGDEYINKSSYAEELIKEISINKADNAETRVNVPQRAGYSFCTKCGRPLDGNTNKCVVCDAAEVGGTAYHRNITQEKMEERDMADSRKRKSKKTKKNKTVRFLILLVVLVVLFLTSCLLCYKWIDGLLNEGKTKPEANSSSVVVTESQETKATDNPGITEKPSEKKNDNNNKIQTKPTPKPTPKAEPTPKPPKTTEPPQDERQDKHDEILAYYGGEYIYPTYKQIITEKELDEYKGDNHRQMVKLILQEIYAYYGYMFDDDDLIDYFENQSWYRPETSDIEEVEAKLNKFEKENIEIIEEYQREQGWRM